MPISDAPDNKEYGLLGFVEGHPPAAADWEEERVATYPHLIVREFLAFGVMFMTLMVLSILFDAPLEELANPGKTPNPAKAPWYFLSMQELLHYSPPFIAGFVVPGLLVVTICTIPYFRGRLLLVPIGFLIATLIVPMIDGIIWGFLHAVVPDFADASRVYGLPTIVLLALSAIGLFKLALSPLMDDPKRGERLCTRLFLLFVFILLILVLIGTFFRGPEWRWVWPWQ